MPCRGCGDPRNTDYHHLITCNLPSLTQMLKHADAEWIVDNMHLVELEAGETPYSMEEGGQAKKPRHNELLHARLLAMKAEDPWNSL